MWKGRPSPYGRGLCYLEAPQRRRKDEVRFGRIQRVALYRRKWMLKRFGAGLWLAPADAEEPERDGYVDEPWELVDPPPDVPDGPDDD